MAIEQAPPASWLDTRLPLFAGWRNAITERRLPRERPLLATLPALITGTLILLALSGAVLSVYYVAAGGAAYDSLQFIRRSVNYGWLIRSLHASGATMIFGAVYLLLFRRLLGRAYKGPADLVWFLELKLFILLLLTGWLGFVMADGAAGYWSLNDAALAGIRLGGLAGGIAGWIFGGPAEPETLGRMAVFHVGLALLIFAVAGAWFAARRALPEPSPLRRPVAFHPYYTSQYFAAFVIFALIFAILVFFFPHLSENRLNALPPDPLSVPVSLSPPWYLLPFAAIGGLVPHTLGAIFAVIAAVAVLYALPWLDRSAPGMPASMPHKIFLWILAADVIALSVSAGDFSPALTGVFAVWYFLHFLVITPLVTGVP